MTNDPYCYVLDKLEEIKRFDAELYQHCIDVADLAFCIAAYLGCKVEECTELWIAGALHDIGKLFISPEILNKPSRLDPFEFSVVQCHVMMGLNVLAEDSKLSTECLKGILEHHERLDGNGYPLAKTELLQFSQILALSDIYNALVSTRPYKANLSSADTIKIIRQQSSFEEELIDALEETVKHDGNSCSGFNYYFRKCFECESK